MSHVYYHPNSARAFGGQSKDYLVQLRLVLLWIHFYRLVAHGMSRGGQA